MSNVNNNAIRKRILAAVERAKWDFERDDDAAVRKSQRAYDAASNSAEITAAVDACDRERAAARANFREKLNKAFEDAEKATPAA